MISGIELSAYPYTEDLFTMSDRTRYRRLLDYAPNMLWTVLCDERTEVEAYRCELEEMLEHADEIGLLDRDLRSRLRSIQAVTQHGALAEIEVCSFLHERNFPLTPRPIGRGTRSGDILIEGEHPTFIEVKAILDRPEDSLEDRLSHKLARLSQDVEAPYIVWFQITNFASDFRGPTFRRWLSDALASNAKSLNASYSDASGFAVSVRAERIDDLPDEDDGKVAIGYSSGVKSLDHRKQIKKSLDEAYKQLSTEYSSLVILRDFIDFPLRNTLLLDALFGTRAVRITPAGGTAIRQGDGYFQRNSHTGLSAVGHLRVKRTRMGSETHLRIYQNPFSRMPLNFDEFEGPAIQRFLLEQDGAMRWQDEAVDD